MHSYTSLLTMSVIAVFHMALTPGTVAAQNASPFALSAAETASFSAAANAVAARGKVCLIFEDAPFSMTPDAKRIEAFRKPLPVLDAARLLAEAYDYEVAPTESGKTFPNVVILQKRFSDYRDLPDVTFDELNAAHDDMARLISSLSTGAPIKTLTNAALDIADTFDKETLTKAGVNVPANSLTGGQREQILRLANHIYLQDFVDVFRESSGYLGQVKTRGRIEKKKMEGHSAYLEWDGAQAVGVSLRGGDGLTGFAPCYLLGAANEPNITNEPNVIGNEAETKSLRLSKNLVTLGEATSRLTWNNKDIYLSVAKPFTAKRACIFGEKNAAPAVVTRALSNLYGLGVESPNEKTVKIVRPRLKRIQSIAEFRERMILLTPAPLARYLRFREIATWDIDPATAAQRMAGDPNWESLPPKERHQSETFRRSWQLSNEAMARMAPAFAAASKNLTRPETVKPLSSLSFDALPQKTQDWFAVYWFNRFAAARLQACPVQVPDYLSHFDDATIQAGWKWSEADKDNVFFCRIRIKRADGSQTGAGVTTNRSTRFPE